MKPDFNKGLIPTVVQSKDGTILMVAYSNEESFERSKTTGDAWYFSRSRQRLWRKGETSGNTQRIVDVRLDCDDDAILFIVEQRGPACHTGSYSCFGERPFSLQKLFDTITDRKLSPKKGSYITGLFEDKKGALNKVLEKVGEETTEVIIAAKDGQRDLMVAEIADLLFHTLVLCAVLDIPLDTVVSELKQREK